MIVLRLAIGTQLGAGFAWFAVVIGGSGLIGVLAIVGSLIASIRSPDDRLHDNLASAWLTLNSLAMGGLILLLPS
jgi:hypothetical protein